MPDVSTALQITFALFSVPLVTVGLTWLGRRFTKEGRLTTRLERLSGIYPNLPDGEARREFAERVNETTVELNTRLDPLFRQERRRKRKVVISLAVVLAVVSIVVLPFFKDAGFISSASAWLGIAGGLIGVGAFFLIERDTTRQRAALRAAQEQLIDATDARSSE